MAIFGNIVKAVECRIENHIFQTLPSKFLISLNDFICFFFQFKAVGSKKSISLFNLFATTKSGNNYNVNGFVLAETTETFLRKKVSNFIIAMLYIGDLHSLQCMLSAILFYAFLCCV